MVFAIMYKINTAKKNYSALYERIKSLGSWMHYLDSTWLVVPSEKKTPTEVYDQLIPMIDGENDYLLVIEVKNNYRGWLPKDAWEWMEKMGYK